jgi:hypothetical protein
LAFVTPKFQILNRLSKPSSFRMMIRSPDKALKGGTLNPKGINGNNGTKRIAAERCQRLFHIFEYRPWACQTQHKTEFRRAVFQRFVMLMRLALFTIVHFFPIYHNKGTSKNRVFQRFPYGFPPKSLFKIWNFGVANAKILPCRL